MNFNTFLMSENNYQQGFDLQNRNSRDQEKSIKTRKAAVIFLAVLGVFFVGLGFYQMSSRIKRPFKISDSVNGGGSAEERYLSVLQSRDTDGDGLFDYDEINIHKTSVYLEDSDSDGLSDYDEIKSMSDPNCPKGTDCYGLASNFENSTSSAEVILPEIASSSVGTETSTDEDKLIEGISTGEVDISILRSLLLANGFSEEDLNKISDEDLKTVYLNAVTVKTQEAAENESATQ